ncbi:MAG: hypothetical protein M0P31_15380 [Solirubrobacteraceae bacterium]|nr:hypothetical protein [Solirubrobacteraceae bacterium]
MTDPTPQHLSWPLQLVPAPGGGRMLAQVEQGSDEEILRGVALLCELRPGDLPWDVDLGIPNPIGAATAGEHRDAALDRITTAVRRIESRVPVTVDVLDTPDGRTLRPRLELETR